MTHLPKSRPRRSPVRIVAEQPRGIGRHEAEKGKGRAQTRNARATVRRRTASRTFRGPKKGRWPFSRRAQKIHAFLARNMPEGLNFRGSAADGAFGSRLLVLERGGNDAKRDDHAGQTQKEPEKVHVRLHGLCDS